MIVHKLANLEGAIFIKTGKFGIQARVRMGYNRDYWVRIYPIETEIEQI